MEGIILKLLLGAPTKICSVKEKVQLKCSTVYQLDLRLKKN